MTAPQQLSTLDTAFLEVEQAQENAHMHIGGALVFDALPDGGAPSLEQLQERIGERLGLLPLFSKRLSEPQTSPVRWLTWEPMPDFDPASHVRRATLPAPGGRAELEEWLGNFWSHRLDRRRPLWSMTLVDGLEDGGWAIATKTHHCLVDGVGAVDITFLVLDALGDAVAAEDSNGVDAEPVGSRHFLHPDVLKRNVRAVTQTVAHPRDAIEKARAAIDLLAGDDLSGSARTSLAGELTATRCYRTARISIADIRRVRQTHGGTLNDVVLAVCSGALRDLFLARGEEPPAGFRAQVPVNIRRDDHAHDLGNEVTNMLVDLPIEEPDPLTRLQRVIEREAELKAGSQQAGSKAWLDLADIGPPGIGGIVARILFGNSKMFGVTITNVPGPQLELSASGATMRDALPFVPLFAEHTLGIAIFSYNGSLTFGICADRHNVPDADVVAGGIERSFAELHPERHRRRAHRPATGDHAPAAV